MYDRMRSSSLTVTLFIRVGNRKFNVDLVLQSKRVRLKNEDKKKKKRQKHKISCAVTHPGIDFRHGLPADLWHTT